jgi:GTP-binding protein
MNKNLPIVAIVGRTNVGKSSIFNTILKKRQAIVADMPGTTRDNVVAIAEFEGSNFWLVDTAGLKDAEDEFEASIQNQIEEASAAADLILVVVEAGTLPTDDDRKVAKKAIKSGKPTILLVNKIDTNPKEELNRWRQLGIANIVAVSATQRIGIKSTLNLIKTQVPTKKNEQDPNQINIALVGRPNVGKSYLFNTLSKKQQAIVSNVAGTTRDIGRISIRFKGKTINLLDTAGIRRSGKIERGVEKFSVLRTLQAIEESDVCLLLMDVNELNTGLDQKIASMVAESGKGLIIVVSKWDTADNKDAYLMDSLSQKVVAEFQFVAWAQLLFVSSLTGQNVTKILELTEDIMNRRAQQIPTTKLNKVIETTLKKHGAVSAKNIRPRIRYAVQSDTNPPWFKVYGTHLGLLHWSTKRQIEKAIRVNFDYAGSPIKFSFYNSSSGRNKDKD